MRNREFVDHDDHKCCNCGIHVNTKDLVEIENLGQRISAGEIVPSGECPRCGALCHPWAPGLKRSSPSTVVVTISGGVADAQAMPTSSQVQILMIDFDDLEAPESTIEDLRNWMDQVKRLPGHSAAAKKYRTRLLTTLKRMIRNKRKE